jgi:hypothetical protein
MTGRGVQDRPSGGTIPTSVPFAPSDMEEKQGKDAESVSSRRLKKRESDRRCQRLARERTKARIAYLEGLVEDFQKQDTSGNVASLMEQLDIVGKERDQLAKTLEGIRKVMHDAAFPTEPKLLLHSESLSDGKDQLDSPHSTPLTGRSNPQFATHHFPTTLTRSSTGAFDSPDGQSYSTIDSSGTGLNGGFDRIDYRDDADTDEAELIYPKKEDCNCSNKHTHSNPDIVNKWRFANEVLTSSKQWRKEDFCRGDAYEDDVLVRAILHGWESVGHLPPVWICLSPIDKELFYKCSKPERLAIMRMMSLLMKWHKDPTEERLSRLPSWFLKRYLESPAL